VHVATSLNRLGVCGGVVVWSCARTDLEYVDGWAGEMEEVVGSWKAPPLLRPKWG